MSESSVPRSSQAATHPQLERVVRRHLKHPWQQPIRAHTRAAFATVAAQIDLARPLVLDSGCGTGHSTAFLASLHPDAVVIGIDKSVHRLARCPELPDNAVLLRADLADFWRLARAAGWRLDRHYLFYPNPWPKPGQLMRRWHAHPAFPDLLALGGQLEVRSNFELYVREFEQALRIAGIDTIEVVSLVPDQITTPVSPFERKYATSGHPLYRLSAELRGDET
jgi:tRNA (guanine-N7-)-methyltransferase